MLAARPPDRLDRHVRRSHVRMGAGESRHRVKFALEEALRLAELPGEREGRVYYFRKVSLGAIPAQASRRLWMASVQQALAVSAGAALHGCDPRADAADVVYFDSEEQAVELQLRRALRPGSAPTWFTPAAFGASAGGDSSSIVLRIVEWLRQSMPPKAAATLILAALGNASPVELLARLPIGAVRAWLQERAAGRDAPPAAAVIPILPHIKHMLQQAAAQFGWQEPHTVWLATLMLQSLAPATVAVESTASRARSILQKLAADESGSPQHAPATAWGGDDLARVVFAGETMPQNADAGSGIAQKAASVVGAADAAAESLNSHSPMAATRSSLRPAVVWTPMLGEPTAAAGLYFLLQALRHVGIKDALASCPELAASNFVPKILRRLAAHAEVPAEDPISWCLDVAEAELPSAEYAIATQSVGAWPWPSNLNVRPGTDCRMDVLVRLWALGVRRWCWREGRITVREIVCREGRVWLTRTDLDVTLPMDRADVRIRRIGLDIDPGWLPWFGKVVRFHYRDRDPQ
jgi:hypothetical protein